MTIDNSKKRSIKELGNVIAFRREYAAICDDDVKCGLFLCQADYWTTISIKMGRSGWFYKKHDDWYGEIGLSRSELDLIRKKLITSGLLQEKKKGTPPVMHYRIDQSVLRNMIQDLYGQSYEDAIKNNSAKLKDANCHLQETDECIRGKQTNAFAGNQHYNTETTTETTSDIKNISSAAQIEADFAEFWSAYPKRPNNSRKKAFTRYMQARRNGGVTHEILMAAVKAYAIYRDGKDPEYTALASTWLNEERWNCDYEKSADVTQSHKGMKAAADMDDVNLTELVKLYPGHVGVYPDVQAAVKSQLRIGATLDQICEAAKKYAQYLKELRYDGRETAPPMIETWLKFKWREMDAYEFARVGPDRRLTVRPKRKV